MEVKNEAKLRTIFELIGVPVEDNLLDKLIRLSFQNMGARFMQDCFHHNAHINYLKISPALRFAMNMLSNKIDSIIPETNNEQADVYQSRTATLANGELFAVIRTFLQNITDLFAECLVYVEAVSIKKFFVDNFFGSINFDDLVRLSFVCVDYVSEHIERAINGDGSLDHVLCACDCIVHIINLHALFHQSESYYTGDKSTQFFEAIIDVSYRLVYDHLANKQFIHRNALAGIIEQQQRVHRLSDDIETRHAKAIFLGKFIEQYLDDRDNSNDTLHATSTYCMQSHCVSLNYLFFL